MAEDDRRRGEIITVSPLGNENQKQLERNAALERDGYVHHRNTVKVKGSSLSEDEVTVVSRTNLLPGKFLSKNHTYVIVLQGTGLGVFFLTVFGSFRLWHLLPASVALAL